MSLESMLKTRLRPLVGNRAWPDFRPLEASKELPFITWQQISGEVHEFLEGGAPALRNARVQVNVWAGDRETANTLMRAVENDLLTIDKRTSALGALTATYDTTVKLYGARQDFSVTHVD